MERKGGQIVSCVSSEHIPCLKQSGIKAIHLFPLEGALHTPDVVVVEDKVEELMWIGMAYVNATGGKRIVSSTAILQSTCVDAAVIP